MSEADVLVEVISDAEPGREIGWGEPSVAEKLERRIDDIRVAMPQGASAIARSLPELQAAQGRARRGSVCPVRRDPDR